MNSHADIQKHLPAYCGGDLEPAERELVETHLAECPDCRSELANLQTTLRLIRTTPEVEPPPWLTGRIMARIREQQTEKRSWLPRLFYPLHIKLPLEAIALLMVCVSGYYLSRTVETELQAPHVTEEAPRKNAVQAPAADHQPAPAPMPRAPAPKAVDQPVSSSPTPPSSPAPTTPAFAPSPPVSRPEQAAPVMQEKAARDALKSEPKAFSATPAGRAADTLSGQHVARLTLRLAVADPSNAAAAVRSAAINSGATVIEERQPSPDHITIRIPVTRTAELFDHIARIGRIVERPQLTESVEVLEVTIRW